MPITMRWKLHTASVEKHGGERLSMVNGVVYAPDHATRNDNLCDHFITSRNCVHAVKKVMTVSDTEFKPHHPSRTWLGTRPRVDAFRQIQSYGKFEAWLPLGPQRAVHYLPPPPRRTSTSTAESRKQQ